MLWPVLIIHFLLLLSNSTVWIDHSLGILVKSRWAITNKTAINFHERILCIDTGLYLDLEFQRV